MNRILSLVLAALLLTAAAPLLAQQAAPAGSGESPVESIFSRWDTDHSGLLSRDEFAKGWAEQAVAARRSAMEAVQEGLQAQFDAVDANDNAAIDADEYDGLVLVQRAGTAAPALSAFDADGDARLQYSEYLQLVRRLAGAQRTGDTP